MIRFYLGEEPILQQRADLPLRPAGAIWPTCSTICDELVVKEARGSGGYGMLVGPQATRRGARGLRAPSSMARPGDYIAQPTLALSTCPTFVESGHRAAPRRSAALRAQRQGHPHRAGRADPRRPARRLAGGQFEPGRRHQGHLGAGKLARMLSRTADSLFWLARYMERAENIARIVHGRASHGAAWRARSATPATNGTRRCVAAGCERGLLRQARRRRRPRRCIDYLVRDPDNPSSIALLPRDGAAQRARRAHRAHRRHVGARSTRPGCECAQRQSRSPWRRSSLRVLLEWVKERSLLFNGAYVSTMLRNDAFYFTRLGTFLERADNTARILDVKYHVLLPQPRGRRRRARLLPVAGDPALGLGAAQLSLGLSGPAASRGWSPSC